MDRFLRRRLLVHGFADQRRFFLKIRFDGSLGRDRRDESGDAFSLVVAVVIPVEDRNADHFPAEHTGQDPEVQVLVIEIIVFPVRRHFAPQTEPGAVPALVEDGDRDADRTLGHAVVVNDPILRDTERFQIRADAGKEALVGRAGHELILPAPAEILGDAEIVADVGNLGVRVDGDLLRPDRMNDRDRATRAGDGDVEDALTEFAAVEFPETVVGGAVLIPSVGDGQDHMVGLLTLDLLDGLQEEDLVGHPIGSAVRDRRKDGGVQIVILADERGDAVSLLFAERDDAERPGKLPFLEAAFEMFADQFQNALRLRLVDAGGAIPVFHEFVAETDPSRLRHLRREGTHIGVESLLAELDQALGLTAVMALQRVRTEAEILQHQGEGGVFGFEVGVVIRDRALELDLEMVDRRHLPLVADDDHLFRTDQDREQADRLELARLVHDGDVELLEALGAAQKRDGGGRRDQAALQFQNRFSVLFEHPAERGIVLLVHQEGEVRIVPVDEPDQFPFDIQHVLFAEVGFVSENGVQRVLLRAAEVELMPAEIEVGRGGERLAVQRLLEYGGDAVRPLGGGDRFVRRNEGGDVQKVALESEEPADLLRFDELFDLRRLIGEEIHSADRIAERRFRINVAYLVSGFQPFESGDRLRDRIPETGTDGDLVQETVRRDQARLLLLVEDRADADDGKDAVRRLDRIFFPFRKNDVHPIAERTEPPLVFVGVDDIPDGKPVGRIGNSCAYLSNERELLPDRLDVRGGGNLSAGASRGDAEQGILLLLRHFSAEDAIDALLRVRDRAVARKGARHLVRRGDQFVQFIGIEIDVFREFLDDLFGFEIEEGNALLPLVFPEGVVRVANDLEFALRKILAEQYAGRLEVLLLFLFGRGDEIEDLFQFVDLFGGDRVVETVGSGGDDLKRTRGGRQRQGAVDHPELRILFVRRFGLGREF